MAGVLGAIVGSYGSFLVPWWFTWLVSGALPTPLTWERVIPGLVVPAILGEVNSLVGFCATRRDTPSLKRILVLPFGLVGAAFFVCSLELFSNERLPWEDAKARPLLILLDLFFSVLPLAAAGLAGCGVGWLHQSDRRSEASREAAGPAGRVLTDFGQSIVDMIARHVLRETGPAKAEG
jgi:hypothetical protein